jgi:uncharacterized protein (DUF2235 family)
VSKKIVLFSDGTGNSSAKAQKTNVWRLFQALDQTTTDQIAKYDDGVGTSSNKYLAAIGGAFGFGLKRNVLDLYRFVCRNWQQGDEIFGFGFSRGAFTIRVLVGLIAKEGLITYRSEIWTTAGLHGWTFSIRTRAGRSGLSSVQRAACCRAIRNRGPTLFGSIRSSSP